MKKGKWKRILWILLVVILVVGAVGWYYLFRNVPETFASEDDFFKYGSIGAERTAGLPYPIFLALPKVCADLMPGEGYESFGLLYDDGRDVPVGLTKKTIGFPRVALNCAFCHIGTVRETPEGEPFRILTGTSTKANAQAYIRFLAECGTSDGFNTKAVYAAINEVAELGWIEKLLYRFAIIPGTKKTLGELKESFEWMEVRPVWGPGRFDDFNTSKFTSVHMPVDDTIGTVDIMPLWTLASPPRENYHWDSSNPDFAEVNVAGSLPLGVQAKDMDLAIVDRINKYLLSQEAPKYPYAINQELAAAGQAIFAAQCSNCHASGKSGETPLIEITELGTDPHRLDMWTQGATDVFNSYFSKEPWGFKHFRKTQGYIALPLAGVWSTGPYLHNGSVPSLRALLSPAEERPARFWRGCDVYDQSDVGFVSLGPVAEGTVRAFAFDTGLPGNGNGGHLFGTDLAPEEKDALLEYLKSI